VYRIGAVEVSPVGGLRQRSVFGGAERMNEPIHSGIESAEVFRALNEARSGVTTGISNAVSEKTLGGIYKAVEMEALALISSQMRNQISMVCSLFYHIGS
jgi:hypothetical protein